MKNIVLFENERVEDLYPFSLTHCSWEVRVGALRLFEKSYYYFINSNIAYLGRKKWLNSFFKRFDILNHKIVIDDTLFLSGNVVISKDFVDIVEDYKSSYDSFLIKSNGNLVGLYCKVHNQEIFDYLINNDLVNLENDVFSNFNCLEVNLNSIEYIWDAIFLNGQEIESDAEFFPNYHSLFIADFQGIYAENPTRILLGKNIKISPSVVLDASKGAIIIGDNVKIMAQSTVIGPCYIGDNSTIKIGAKIYEDCSFGEWCKIGGELENTIIHSYSNKQHEGFLGHSYIGEWVNLGADTNNSDLKNTYSEINMVLPHKDVKTGRIFLGLMCGDHTKTGINSMFTTGTVAGVCGILVKEWFLPNFIKSFTWGGKTNSPTYRFEKAIETSRIVMARRNKVLSDEEIELLRVEYNKQGTA
ncbi:MAG: hypothetical protein KIT33_09680 [Candidatus Kapabacteria bacterium]|nr:hypothetical protein [Ignavibacteriota bacterium]MCW5885227.1 hypothetical protein [Candidatus Kapabacteria bacterium]